MLLDTSLNKSHFYIWILQENRKFTCILLASIIGLFGVFKIIYPFPNFMPPDSNSYMEAAYSNQYINFWAIGYSKFLRFFSCISSSHLALTFFQYLLLQSCMIYFLFSTIFLVKYEKRKFCITLICCILTPIILHVSNFVSSDSLFISLSLIWFTQLLWMLFQPKQMILLLHAIVLLFAFMVRYNALYYPIISVAIICISNYNKRSKFFAIGSIVALIFSFIETTKSTYHSETGQKQFSAFAGWQLAANSLYGYAHAIPDHSSKQPEKFKKLHALVNQHIDSLKKLKVRPDGEVGIYYLWDLKSPLRVYMSQQRNNKTTNSYFVEWASFGPLYAKYGTHLIKKYPSLFAKHFLWPNMLKFYTPPLGFMGYYNMEDEYVENITFKWFKLKDDRINFYFKKNKKIKTASVFPILSSVANLIFVTSFLSILWIRGNKLFTIFEKQVLLLFGTFWFSNMLFSVLAAPIELRYQVFPMITNLTLSFILITLLIKESRNIQKNNTPALNNVTNETSAL